MTILKTRQLWFNSLQTNLMSIWIALTIRLRKKMKSYPKRSLKHFVGWICFWRRTLSWNEKLCLIKRNMLTCNKGIKTSEIICRGNLLALLIACIAQSNKKTIYDQVLTAASTNKITDQHGKLKRIRCNRQ